MEFTTRTDFLFEILLMSLIGVASVFLVCWEIGQFGVIGCAVGMLLGRISAETSAQEEGG